MVSDKKIKSVRAIFRKNFGKSYFAEIKKTNDFSEVHAKLNDAIKEAKEIDSTISTENFVEVLAYKSDKMGFAHLCAPAHYYPHTALQRSQRAVA